jgi:beta-lactamase class A
MIDVLRLPLLVCATTVFVTACGADRLASLRSEIDDRVAATDAETVGIYFKNLESGDSVLLAADRPVHAASMMKVPVLIQLFRDHEVDLLDLADSVELTKTFRSIVDGSSFDLSAPDDADTTLYNRLGERASIRVLAERMITVSSNLATNMLIELVGAERVQATMRELKADSIVVLRGVEDIKAYEAGLSNTTTARDLGVIFTAIADGTAASSESCREMVEILERQEFNEGIPAGVPSEAQVAHKTGWITGIRHDGGIVTLPDGRRYVLVVLTRGIDDVAAADSLIVDVSRLVHGFVTGG